MNKSFYMQAISGNYPWMKMGASVVAWIYFYKWLCIDRHCLLEIKSLEETKNYVKEQLKKEKAKRKFTTVWEHPSPSTYTNVIVFAVIGCTEDIALMPLFNITPKLLVEFGNAS